jgi:GNAT superfamily N-acetyltransferase
MSIEVVEDVARPDGELLAEIDGVLVRAYGGASRRARIERFLFVDDAGWVMLRREGRVVSVGAFIGYRSAGFGWIGLVATEPRAQGGGFGRVITEALIERLRRIGCAAVLDGSKSGAPLYERMGFSDFGLSHALMAPAELVLSDQTPAGLESVQLVPIGAEMMQSVLSFDQHAFGADRRSLLSYLLEANPGRHVAAITEAGLVGYGIAQADLLGPIAADSATTLRAIVMSLHSLDFGSPPSLLVPPECAFLPTLLKLGFTSARTLRRQHLGIGELPGLRGRLCAQASFGEG